jgi:hypothetical protein
VGSTTGLLKQQPIGGVYYFRQNRFLVHVPFAQLAVGEESQKLYLCIPHPTHAAPMLLFLSVPLAPWFGKKTTVCGLTFSFTTARMQGLHTVQQQHIDGGEQKGRVQHHSLRLVSFRRETKTHARWRRMVITKINS